MKKIDYIVIGICVLCIAAAAIFSVIMKNNAGKIAVDKYKIEQLHAQDLILKHQSDSINTALLSQNKALVAQVAQIVAQRDSMTASATRQISNIHYEYQNKISHLSRLPDDELHSIFAKQLSSSGSH
ncbi:MAG: hypothetical protein JWO03_2868 [Bacteroidetes bacterium]|nr:hypothetical protein [Bacteroidota bacterium]